MLFSHSSRGCLHSALSQMRIFDYIGSHSPEKWERKNPYGGHTKRHLGWGVVHSWQVGQNSAFLLWSSANYGEMTSCFKMLRIIQVTHYSWLSDCTRPCTCCFLMFLFLNLLHSSGSLYEITFLLTCWENRASNAEVAASVPHAAKWHCWYSNANPFTPKIWLVFVRVSPTNMGVKLNKMECDECRFFF